MRKIKQLCGYTIVLEEGEYVLLTPEGEYENSYETFSEALSDLVDKVSASEVISNS